MEAYNLMTEGEKVKFLFEKLNIQHNTDAKGEVKPQLALSTPWKADGKTTYPKLLETKFDGLRSLIKLEWSPSQQSVDILSRSGKPYMKMTHIADVLIAYMRNFNTTGTMILDGELYLHGLPLADINKAVKGESDFQTKIQFWVYDLPLLNMKQVLRSKEVENIVLEINNPLIKSSASCRVERDSEVIAFHDDAVDKGFEGAMLKDPNGMYKPGQRNAAWTKVKMFDDHEFEIVGYKLGQRGVQDLMFICYVGNYVPNTSGSDVFDVTMNGTIESKEALFADIKNCIGNQLTVRHFGFTKYGVPNIAKGKCIRQDG